MTVGGITTSAPSGTVRLMLVAFALLMSSQHRGDDGSIHSAG